MNIYLLSDNFHKGVINLPQIEVKYRDVDLDFTSYDTLIFSSKNGVKSIAEKNTDWKNLSSFAIGNPTANEIIKLGGRVEYVAKSSYGNDFAKELIPLLKHKKVLFIRAKKVLSNLEKILKEANINLSSQIVYETVCRKKTNEKFKSNSIFIFTSPSTIKCFFKNYEWLDSYKAVCIGDVTAKELPINVSFYISKIQTIDACIELAKTLIKQN